MLVFSRRTSLVNLVLLISFPSCGDSNVDARDDASTEAATSGAAGGTEQAKQDEQANHASQAKQAEQGGQHAPPQPTPEHAELLKDVGSWEGTLQSFMPGVPNEPVAASEEVVAVGGFWIHARFECTFMGQPYVGTGCVGYDEKKKCYIGTWVDSMTSFLANMEGKRDPKSKAVEMVFMAPNPEGKMTRHRSVTVRTANTRTMTFYTGEGEGEKYMVIDLKRK